MQTDVKLSNEPFLRNTGLNTVTDNPPSVNEVLGAVIGDQHKRTFYRPM
jgi:hypothetical protein